MIRWVRRQWYKLFFYESLDSNRLYGKFRVVYPDGKRSQPFCWETAQTYASIFGGKVIDNF